MESAELKDRISEVYSEKIQESQGCCDGAESCGTSYPLDLVDSMPEGAVSFGCGNPVALAALQRGQTVLDLGSGAGLDCFLAARQVGPAGSVVGVDFTQAMIDRATENAQELGLANVSFLLGDI